MRRVSLQPSSIGIVTKPRVTMKEKLNGGMTVVTQWTRCHGNDETARVRRSRCSVVCRVAFEASLRQVVAWIVTEPQSHDAEATVVTSACV